jgi:hypothetical protein
MAEEGEGELKSPKASPQSSEEVQIRKKRASEFPS